MCSLDKPIRDIERLILELQILLSDIAKVQKSMEEKRKGERAVNVVQGKNK